MSNNQGDTTLRPAVIYRKLSSGTQSSQGSRFVERMLTLTETCRQQSRSAYAYLVQAMRARLEGRKAPRLLPTLADA